MRLENQPRFGGWTATDALRDRRLHPALCQHLVELNPRVRELRQRQNDEGFAIISENSLISGLPSTLMPYANFFVGFATRSRWSMATARHPEERRHQLRDRRLTVYPKLNDSGSNAYGGAHRFAVSLQSGSAARLRGGHGAALRRSDRRHRRARPQYGFGVRYQIPIDRAWLFRADATYQIVEGSDKDTFGVRAEIRRKF
jgi:hypothetical protein